MQAELREDCLVHELALFLYRKYNNRYPIIDSIEKRSIVMKIVISVLGRDRVGIIAMVATVLAENGVNILNLDQTILDGFFNMIMTADMSEAKISLKELQEVLKLKGEAIGLEIRVQHADIFQVMHRV
jgi:ACT domain-containing protein